MLTLGCGEGPMLCRKVKFGLPRLSDPFWAMEVVSTASARVSSESPRRRISHVWTSRGSAPHRRHLNGDNTLQGTMKYNPSFLGSLRLHACDGQCPYHHQARHMPA